MAQYTNSTLNSNDWELYFQPSPHSECLVIFIILFYGLKIQLQKLNHQRNLIKGFKKKVVHMLVTLMNWCAYMQDYDDAIIEKHVVNAKVIPYENKTIVKPEREKGRRQTSLGYCPGNHGRAKTGCLSH